ncbi:hypothetical protein [Arenimonas composti]|uniref:Uncharacterized protein n=1 Tax=Arenimonas composti TR7-09 = DSM 18010 TaxID=1121013 RepID=A0A091BAA6_9GAMM|nr:hypothetical protein [Arenimonas composti]KFN48671.1 hypothetical protein P873_13950 [Arenimonas composti TR7-09 = DSM 18010]
MTRLLLPLLFAAAGAVLLILAIIGPRVLARLPRNRLRDGRLAVNRTEAGVLGPALLLAGLWCGPWLVPPGSSLLGALVLALLAATGVHAFLRHGNEPLRAKAAAAAKPAADSRAKKRRKRRAA